MLELKRKIKTNTLSNRDKVVFGYHYFNQDNPDGAIHTLNMVDSSYWITQFHKDISRALLAEATYKITQNPTLGKESEFYLIVYRLTKIIITNKVHFNGSGHFYQLKDELFKGLM